MTKRQTKRAARGRLAPGCLRPTCFGTDVVLDQGMDCRSFGDGNEQSGRGKTLRVVLPTCCLRVASSRWLHGGPRASTYLLELDWNHWQARSSEQSSQLRFNSKSSVSTSRTYRETPTVKKQKENRGVTFFKAETMCGGQSGCRATGPACSASLTLWRRKQYRVYIDECCCKLSLDSSIGRAQDCNWKSS